MTYRAYGLRLESDRPLPELEIADGSNPDWRIAWVAVVRPPRGARWTTLWRFSDGEPWVTVARAASARYFRFGRFADFRISGDLIEVAPRGRVSDATLRHLLLDQAVPLALAARGELVLHASAVRIDDAAVLLMGEAGSGKSTLAALLALEGCPVLADDGVLMHAALEGIEAVPSYPGLRLWPDALALASVGGTLAPVAEYTRKQRVVPTSAPTRFASCGALVRRVYTLAPGGSQIVFEPLSRRDGAVEIVKHSYRADLDARSGPEAQLDAIARVSSALQVWRIAFPRDLSQASQIARAIRQGH
jgi:hypothetical protein